MRCRDPSARACPTVHFPTLNSCRTTLVIENSRGLLGSKRTVHIGPCRPGLLVVHWRPGSNEVILRQSCTFDSETGLRVAVTRPPCSQVATIEPVVVGCPPHSYIPIAKKCKSEQFEGRRHLSASIQPDQIGFPSIHKSGAVKGYFVHLLLSFPLYPLAA
jgi:hypothetical protein